MTNHYDVIIVGGGIAGLATAVALLRGRAGTPPQENCSSSSSSCTVPPLRLAVLERATKLRPVGAALGLFPNGLNALQAISPTVHDKVLESCIPATVMYVKDAADPQKILQQMGGQTSQKGNTSSNNNNNKDNDKETPQKQQQQESTAGTSSSSSGGNSSSVGVGGVHMMVWYLLQQYLAGELPCNVVRLGTSVEAVEILSSSSPSSTNHHNDDENNNKNDPAQIKVTILNRVTGEKETLYCHVLIGADGIHSTVRQTLWPSCNNKLLYHNKLMFRAVMECKLLDAKYCPPTGEQLAYQGQVAGKLFAFRETSPGLLTFTSMANFDNDDEPNFGATAAERKARLEQLFCDYPADVRHILNQCPADAIYVNAVYDLEQVVDQWSRKCVVLIGDAAHAMTPGMGQGANMGLEDAAELAYFVLKTLKTHHRHNGDGENTSSSSWPSAAIMASTLEEFWKSRIDRVKMVHQGSRLRTLMNNQASSSSSSSTSSSSKTVTDANNKNDDSNNKGVALLYTQNQDIREQVHGWKPSIREEAEEET